MIRDGETIMRFSGETILVAGGTGGLGKSVSLAFLEEGATVVVTYRNPEEFAALKSVAGPNATALEGQPVDVTEEVAVSRLVDRILNTYGRLDALVNTVGGYAGGVKLWELDAKTFDQMLTLNLRSGLVLSRAVIPPMLAKSRGTIVNVASKAAFDHFGGAAAYAASKAAAVAMINSLAEDLKGTGVRANSILPSIIDTPANRKAMPGADFAKWPKPQDIARVVLFLCSDDAKVIHGAAVSVYGAD
jgi:NAD(P)-dependent dehydrogenase (short-subunit alcohol dehydrogenase family)